MKPPALPDPASEHLPPPSRLGFRRAQRLSHAREFQAVYAARLKKVAGPLIVWGKPGGGREWRLGLSVGKRVGNAVARNRAKRLVREAFRLSHEELEAIATGGTGLDLVVSVRAPAGGGGGKKGKGAAANGSAAALTLEEVRRHLLDAARRIHKEWGRRAEREAQREEGRAQENDA